MLQIIAGYKFISLNNLQILQQLIQANCSTNGLQGTILLSAEGININLAGHVENIRRFKNFLSNHAQLSCLNDIHFHENTVSHLPFKRLKIKIKKEIITLRSHAALDLNKRAPALSPEIFKQWQDENRAMIVLDTRNDYEIKFGTFTNAVNLHLQHFSDFPNAISSSHNTCGKHSSLKQRGAGFEKNKTIVMFCTGGIRCEKAALIMMQKGFNEVYQLDGGILNYFTRVGQSHFQGNCFVFDERIAIDANFTPFKNRDPF